MAQSMCKQLFKTLVTWFILEPTQTARHGSRIWPHGNQIEPVPTLTEKNSVDRIWSQIQIFAFNLLHITFIMLGLFLDSVFYASFLIFFFLVSKVQGGDWNERIWYMGPRSILFLQSHYVWRELHSFKSSFICFNFNVRMHKYFTFKTNVVDRYDMFVVANEHTGIKIMQLINLHHMP